MHYVCIICSCREQLIRCREHLDQLLAQCDSLEKKIAHYDRQEQEWGQEEEEEEGKISVASVGLFQSQLGKVRREIAAEEEVEKGIEDKLQVLTVGRCFVLPNVLSCRERLAVNVDTVLVTVDFCITLMNLAIFRCLNSIMSNVN